MSSPLDGPMIADARRAPQIWLLAIGIIAVFVFLAFWTLAMVASLAWMLDGSMPDAAYEMFGTSPPRPAQTIYHLVLIAGLGSGTIIAARLFQRRSPASLTGPPAKTLRHLVLSALTAFAVLGILSSFALPLYGMPLPNLALATWVLWLPFGLLALTLQTGAEELFFRGYLQSQLAARFGSPMAAVVLPSVLFGLIHYIPALPAIAALTYILIATMFGILAADLTLRTGSLGAAWGFHLGNNTLTILIVAPGEAISGLALWKSSNDTLTQPIVTLEILMLLATWWAIRRVLQV